MNHVDLVKKIKSLSTWLLIQALTVTPLIGPAAWAQEQEILSVQGLRREQQEESPSGLAVLLERLLPTLSQGTSGLEENPTSVEEAMGFWFHGNSGRAEEIRLENFLAERWEGQIRSAASALASSGDAQAIAQAEAALATAVERHENQIAEFVRRIEEDRTAAGLSRNATVEHWRLPPIDPARDIPAAGQKSGSGALEIDIPSNRADYEIERLHLMARLAIQRALGREVVVNVGIGFVGTAVSTATAAESNRDYGQLDAGERGALQYRPPLEGQQRAYFTIAYQRPSPASAFKVPAMNSGIAPLRSDDPTVGEKIEETTQAGVLVATFLPGSIAVADTVMLETELHIAKVLPTHLEHSAIQDESTLRLVTQVGGLMRTDALVIIESTIAPGFTRNRLLPALNTALRGEVRASRGLPLLPDGQDANLAHAFQRLEPGSRWYRSLLEQERVGAGVTAQANEKLASYFTTVGFTHRLFDRVEAVEFMKTLENAWRFGLLELMNSYMRAAEIVGVDSYEIARLIARARPDTHGLISVMASLQVGGYCVPKEMIQIVKAMADYYGINNAEIVSMFDTRFGAAVASDFRGRLAASRAAEAMAKLGRQLDDAHLHVLGITYGPGVADTRMAGPERAVREFADWGVNPANISATDAYAENWDEVFGDQQLLSPESWGYGLRNQNGLTDISFTFTDQGSPLGTLNPTQDVLLMGTRHFQYVGANRLTQIRADLESETLPNGTKKTAQQREKDRATLAKLDDQSVTGLDPAQMSARMMGQEGKVLIDTFDFFSDEDYKVLLALGWQVEAFGKGHLDTLEESLTTTERIDAVNRLITELRALRGNSDVDQEDLAPAIAKAQAKLRALRQRQSAEAASKPTAQTRRAKLTEAAEAEHRWYQADQQRYYAEWELEEALEWFDDEDPRVVRLQRRVALTEAQQELAEAQQELARREAESENVGRQRSKVAAAQTKVNELETAQRQGVAQQTEDRVVRPALRRAAAMVKRTNFMHGVPARYLMTLKPLTGAQAAEVDSAVRGPSQRSQVLLLASQLDQAFHTMDYILLDQADPDEIDAMLADVRHVEEALHPERALEPETRTVPYRLYGDKGEVVSTTEVEVNAVHPFRWRVDLETGELVVETDNEHWTNVTVKQLPNLAATDLPEHWGRHFVMVRPKLVPIDAATSEMRAYPHFDDLPPELAMWLAREVHGKGYVLTTLDSPDAIEQDKIEFAMVIDPAGAGSGRAGYLVWADSGHPVVSITPEGYEVPSSIKGIGLFVGGDERFPHTNVQVLGTTTGRQVSGGFTAGGGVGQSMLAQTPGFVGGVGQEHGLSMIATSDGHFNGQAPRLVSGVNYTFAHGPTDETTGAKSEYFTSIRQEFDTARMGWYFRSDEFDHQERTNEAAEVLGWNAAELLGHLPHPVIHIALSLDNVQANGYFTDPDSIVPPLYLERNPYGALFKYFGFSMQQIVMGWEQMKASRDGTPYDLEDEHFMRLRHWMRGFMGHMLASGKVRRAPLEKFNRFSKMSDEEFLAAVRSEYGGSNNEENFRALVVDLIDTLWNNYLAHSVLRDRLRFGYDFRVESTYTGTANEQLNLGAVESAVRYHDANRSILTTARANIDAGMYPAMNGFDFDAALAELATKESRRSQIASTPAVGTDGAAAFGEVYPMSFYPATRPTQVALLDLGAVERGERAIHLAGEVPAAASLVEKEVVTASAGAEVPTGPAAGGLEEVTANKPVVKIADLQAMVADPDGSGFRTLLGSMVPEDWSERDAWIEEEIEKAQAVVAEAVEQNLFAGNIEVAMVRTTGRARIFMGHPDLPGIGGFSVDTATPQGMWILVQLTDDGFVIADNMDERFDRLEFGLFDEDVLPTNAPEIKTRAQWLDWARNHEFLEDRWQGLVKGSLAVVRTGLLDPRGRRRDYMHNRGVRILVGESDIPSGKGFSASSAIPAGLSIALNGFFQQDAPQAILTPDQLRYLDLAAYLVRDLAGLADITAAFEGVSGEASVITYDPDYLRERVEIPDGIRLFAVDAGERLDAPGASEDAKNLAAHIKTMTNVAPPLAVLWARHLAYSTRGLRPLERIMTVVDEGRAAKKAAGPRGVLRGLTSLGALTGNVKVSQRQREIYERMLGDGTRRRGERARREFVENVMFQVPNDWTLGQILQVLETSPLLQAHPELGQELEDLKAELVPIGAHRIRGNQSQRNARLEELQLGTVVPMRQMAQYGLREIERGQAYIAAARANDVLTMVRLMREAHDGDRGIWNHNRQLAGNFLVTQWGIGQPPEAFQRSMPAIDDKVDRFQKHFDDLRGPGKVAARISGAGLGGYLMVAVPEDMYEEAVAWWSARRPKPDIVEVVPSTGVRLITVTSEDQFASQSYTEAGGLEELTTESFRTLEVRGVPVLELLQKVPPRLDDSLDEPVNVGLIVADFDDTFNSPGTEPLSEPMQIVLGDFVVDLGTRLWVNSGSSVGDASGTDIERRFLVPMEQAIGVTRAQPSALQQIRFQGAVGQQVVEYRPSGERWMHGIPEGPTFSRQEQIDVLRLWLAMFVEQFPGGRDRAAWAEQVATAQSPERLEAIALELEEAWKVSRVRFARRGINVETGLMDPDHPGMLTMMLPKDGSLRELAHSMGEAFDQQLRSGITGRRLEETIPGSKFVTVLFYKKEVQILEEYNQLARTSLPVGSIVVTFGDNPASDTFFNLTSDDFGRPVLHFLVDESYAEGRPELLVPALRHVPGSQQTLEMLRTAQRTGQRYREIPLFNSEFSIADIEREVSAQFTGEYSWEDIRRIAAGGLEEAPTESALETFFGSILELLPGRPEISLPRPGLIATTPGRLPAGGLLPTTAGSLQPSVGLGASVGAGPARLSSVSEAGFSSFRANYPGGLSFRSVDPASTGLLVDLSESSDLALLALELPFGTSVLLDSLDSLFEAERILQTRADQRGIRVFFVDQSSFPAALNAAVGGMRGFDAIRVLSTRDTATLRSALNTDRSIPVTVTGNLRLRTLLTNAGAIANEALSVFYDLLADSGALDDYL